MEPVREIESRKMKDNFCNDADVDDLTKLDDVTLDNVIDCLIERFNHQKYCTLAGSVLISLNPCSTDNSKQNRLFASSENEDMKRFEDASKQIDESGLKLLEPHVLSVGVKCLYNIKHTRNNQIIVVSGDSGAGKTTCTQDLIKFFTHSHIQTENEEMFPLERKIYEATLILEALGNASTVANPNSSRFGRLVQLQYNSECKIVGAEIKTYLLEKHRVAKGNLNERNFHIFHFLLQAVNKGYFKTNTQVFEESFWMDKIDKEADLSKFMRLQTALTILGLVDEFLEYFHVLFAILHLLSIKFIEVESTEDNKENLSNQMCAKFVVSEETLPHLAEASLILGLDKCRLQNSLIFHTFAAGNRQSISQSPYMRKEDCESKLHALISSLYDQIFHYTVRILNSLLKQDDSSKSATRPSHSKIPTRSDSSLVSILDLYGFERLEFNHFEQLCINYANERIQQVQISVLKGYFQEQLAINNELHFDEPHELNRVENETIQRLDELHNRVFCILDEACLLKRPTLDKVVFERLVLESIAKRDKFISTGNTHDKKCPFIIRHYASEVNYSLAGMITKNNDFIPEEFHSILSRSKSEFVSKLFPSRTTLEENNSPRTPRKNKPESTRKTILMRFKSSVNELVGEICEKENRDVHFIKCIRPNMDLTPEVVQRDVVKRQLYACGIVDIIRITGNGYPIRMSCTKLTENFPILVQEFCGDKLPLKRLASVFASLRFGPSNVFLNEETWLHMKSVEQFIVSRATRKIQDAWRKYIMEKERQDQTPIQIESPDSSIYFTPMTSVCNDSANSTVSFHSTTAGPSYDSGCSYSDSSLDLSIDGSELDSFRQSYRDGWLNDSNGDETTMAHLVTDMDLNSTLLNFSDSDISTRPTPTPIPDQNSTKKFSNLKLYKGDRIFSKAPVHRLPIKIYTKKTALGFIKPPQRLRSNGIQDAYEDYGIILELWNNYEENSDSPPTSTF